MTGVKRWGGRGKGVVTGAGACDVDVIKERLHQRPITCALHLCRAYTSTSPPPQTLPCSPRPATARLTEPRRSRRQPSVINEPINRPLMQTEAGGNY